MLVPVTPPPAVFERGKYPVSSPTLADVLLSVSSLRGAGWCRLPVLVGVFSTRKGTPLLPFVLVRMSSFAKRPLESFFYRVLCVFLIG